MEQTLAKRSEVECFCKSVPKTSELEGTITDKRYNSPSFEITYTRYLKEGKETFLNESKSVSISPRELLLIISAQYKREP